MPAEVFQLVTKFFSAAATFLASLGTHRWVLDLRILPIFRAMLDEHIHTKLNYNHISSRILLPALFWSRMVTSGHQVPTLLSILSGGAPSEVMVPKPHFWHFNWKKNQWNESISFDTVTTESFECQKLIFKNNNLRKKLYRISGFVLWFSTRKSKILTTRTLTNEVFIKLGDLANFFILNIQPQYDDVCDKTWLYIGGHFLGYFRFSKMAILGFGYTNQL